MKTIPPLWLWLLVMSASLTAQDTYLQHFYGNESAFNPAMTGLGGATRIGLSVREQWSGGDLSGYEARAVRYEETLPCQFFDYGLFARMDTEGDGGLKTQELGLRFALKFPLQIAGVNMNFRFGTGLTGGQRQIDYDRLRFLDQYDNLFGLENEAGDPNATDFVPPEGSINPGYTSGSFGVNVRGRIERSRKRTTTFDVGGAVHNPGFLTSEDGQQTASLLGLNTPLGQRVTITGRLDHVLGFNNGRYWSVRPSAVYQRQGGLAYLEAGTGVSWSRNLTVGAYYHYAQPTESGASVNWTSLQVELGSFLSEKTRVDVAFSYAIQYGSLKNYVSAPLELTATFSFAKSGACAAMGYGGMDVDMARSKFGSTDCSSFISAKNHIYDNIWYNPNRHQGR